MGLLAPMISTSSREIKLFRKAQMTSIHHKQNQFGFLYPSSIVGVGSPNDLLSFFEAIKLVSDNPVEAFPYMHVLLKKPVVGQDILPLFEEAQLLQTKFQQVPVTNKVLAALNLSGGRETKMITDAETLAGVYSRIFFVLAEDAPEMVRVLMDEPGYDILERGSIRVGPSEPLVPSSLFGDLPASAFDDAEPPLWLRDEIFEDGFFTGKV